MKVKRHINGPTFDQFAVFEKKHKIIGGSNRHALAEGEVIGAVGSGINLDGFWSGDVGAQAIFRFLCRCAAVESGETGHPKHHHAFERELWPGARHGDLSFTFPMDETQSGSLGLSLC